MNWLKKILHIDNPYETWWYKALSAFFSFTGKIHWGWFYKWRTGGGKDYKLSKWQQETIADFLNKHYLITVTRRDFHLSTYLIMLGNFVKTGRFGFWCHTVQNTEEDPVTSKDDFLLIESVGSGVKVSKFETVFNCDHAALLKPKRLTMQEWDSRMDEIKDRFFEELGREYDNAFLIFDGRRMSCIEYTLAQLKKLSDFESVFPNVSKILKEKNNMTPDMLFESGDFEIVYMAKNKTTML